jgi:ankyrin repeat protein
MQEDYYTDIYNAVCRNDLSEVKLVLAKKSGKIKTFALIRAVCHNFIDIANELIASGKIDLDITNSKHETALSIAISKRNNNLIKNLIKAGANCNILNMYGNNTLMHLIQSIYQIEKDIIRDVIPLTTDLNLKSKQLGAHTALTMISISNVNLGAKKEIIKLLLEAGADPNVKSGSGINCLDIIIRKDSLINKHDIELLETLLKAGADPNNPDTHGRTSLHRLTLNNSQTIINKSPRIISINHRLIEIAKLLVKYGADINKKGSCGNTPLFNALCNNRDIVVIKELVNLGADVHLKNNCYTTTLMQCERDINILRYLLDLGVDVNAQDLYGNTTLMYEACFLEAVKLLIRYGANIDLANNRDLTLLDICNDPVKNYIIKFRAVSSFVIVNNRFRNDKDKKIYLNDDALTKIFKFL